jgi:DNA replication protein DnaC
MVKIMNQIMEYAQHLKLPYIKSNYDEIIKEATNSELGFEEFLLRVLKEESNQRKENSITNKIRNARFPFKKYLEGYNVEVYNYDIKKEIKNLSTLDFIDNKENILLFGNPGVGKSHLAIALGYKACMSNYTVLFISVPNLMIELKEAMNLNQLKAYRKKFEKFDLLILDELGYISFDKESSDILFNLLSNRNNNGSIIITTNLVFERWHEVFKDPMLTTALIDRITHKAHVLDLSGDSYRVKETAEWLKNN